MDKKIIERIASSKILLDILLAFEDFLDSNDLYVYKNWIKGEVIDGPHVSRYWVTITLRYDYKEMPDPDGAKRLIANGLEVEYKKDKQEYYFKDLRMGDAANTTGLGFTVHDSLDKTPKPKHVPVWLIEIKIPRRFIESAIEEDLMDFDDDVDMEDVSDAKDAGVDKETSVKSGEELDDTPEEEEEISL